MKKKRTKLLHLNNLLTESQIKARDKETMYRKNLLVALSERAKPTLLLDLDIKHGDPQMVIEQWYWLLRRKYIVYIDEKGYPNQRRCALTAKGHAMIMEGEFNFSEAELSMYLLFFTEICTGRGRDEFKWKY